MFNSFLTRIFGSRNERVLRQLGKTVAKINALEPQSQALSDDELRERTAGFRSRLAAGATLDSDEVLAWAWERLAKFKLSRVVVVDELPLNPSGKVMKFKLREALS